MYECTCVFMYTFNCFETDIIIRSYSILNSCKPFIDLYNSYVAQLFQISSNVK